MRELTENEPQRTGGTRIAAGTAARFMVVGTTIAETVLHIPLGSRRRGLGGVAATIALALAQEGQDVTLVTSIGRGPMGKEARRLLDETSISTTVRESRGEAGHATISARNGEPVQHRGRWPRAEGLAPLVERELAYHQVVIADTNMPPEDIRRILEHPGKLTMVNATTTRGAARIPRRMENPLGMITVNRAEARALMQWVKTDSEREMMRRMGTDTLLVTLDQQGWRLQQQGGEMVASSAVAVPENTDFVGCGDYAAAGAVQALLHGLEPRETINRFIRRKMEINTATE